MGIESKISKRPPILWGMALLFEPFGGSLSEPSIAKTGHEVYSDWSIFIDVNYANADWPRAAEKATASKKF